MKQSEEPLETTEFGPADIEKLGQFTLARADDLEPPEPWTVEDFDDLWAQTRH